MVYLYINVYDLYWLKNERHCCWEVCLRLTCSFLFIISNVQRFEYWFLLISLLNFIFNKFLYCFVQQFSFLQPWQLFSLLTNIVIKGGCNFQSTQGNLLNVTHHTVNSRILEMKEVNFLLSESTIFILKVVKLYILYIFTNNMSRWLYKYFCQQIIHFNVSFRKWRIKF